MKYSIEMCEDRYYRIFKIYFTIPFTKIEVKSKLKFFIYDPINQLFKNFTPKYVNYQDAVDAAEFYLEHTKKIFDIYVLEPIFVKAHIFMEKGENTSPININWSNEVSTTQKLYTAHFSYANFVGSLTECEDWLRMMEEKTYSLL